MVTVCNLVAGAEPRSELGLVRWNEVSAQEERGIGAEDDLVGPGELAMTPARGVPTNQIIMSPPMPASQFTATSEMGKPIS